MHEYHYLGCRRGRVDRSKKGENEIEQECRIVALMSACTLCSRAEYAHFRTSSRARLNQIKTRH